MGVTPQYWALRERATKRLLPLHRIAMTRVEFGDSGPPRLFTSSGSAKQALDCWRMGQWHLTGDEDGLWPEPGMWKGNEEVKARRTATEVDIVPVRLLQLKGGQGHD